MEFITKFITGFLGNRTLDVYAICFVFAALGAYIITRIRAQKRDKSAEGTPYKFNVWFMIFHNVKDVFFSLSISFVVFRFSNYWIDDETKLYLYAFLLGFCFNAVVWALGRLEEKLSERIKKWVEKF